MRADALERIERDWRARCRHASAAAVLEALREREPDVARLGASSWCELIDQLGRAAPDAAVPHWRVTAALLRCQDLGELVSLGLLVALRPGLLAVGRRLDWGRGGPWPGREDFIGDLVSTAWDVLVSVSGTTLEFPERTVLRRVRQRLAWQRLALRRRVERERPVPDVETADAECEPSRRPGRRPGLGSGERDVRLATLPVLDALGGALEDVRDARLDRADVAIVYAHRVLGYSLREIAARTALATTTVRLRCRRAEALLCGPAG